ncbi:NADP-dependent oxidoreductase [Zhongshania sp.]|uniref:NADP-dependent oxidoreductase n=1 Tax=Zhongshania sp. TaxID=1971902 RepID=UPI0035642401
MSNISNRQWLFVKRPTDAVDESCFKIVTTEVPDIHDGQILLQNLYFSLDASMRTWMNEGPNYLEPLILGQPMRSVTLAKIVKSNNPDFPVGRHVMGMNSWEDYSVSCGDGFCQLLPKTHEIPLSYYLGALGPTGYTAYFGMLDIGCPKSGESVLVSGAAGAVGSIAGQIAKLSGCYVVGLAGSDEKCDWLVSECGYDLAINYKKCDDLDKKLAATFPEGIDIYFDNVGGATLDSALANLANKARIVSCGAVSGYDTGETPSIPIKNHWMLLIREAKMQGFLISSFMHRATEAAEYLGKHIGNGDIRFKEHIVEGFDSAPSALKMLYAGKNTGKLIVKL